MANLQIKGIQDELYEEIKRLAAAENRSVSQHVVYVVREYLSKRKHVAAIKTPAEVLLQLSGSWEDNRSAGEIITDIRRARQNSPGEPGLHTQKKKSVTGDTWDDPGHFRRD